MPQNLKVLQKSSRDLEKLPLTARVQSFEDGDKENAIKLNCEKVKKTKA